jgi:hypothetical protein
LLPRAHFLSPELRSLIGDLPDVSSGSGKTGKEFGPSRGERLKREILDFKSYLWKFDWLIAIWKTNLLTFFWKLFFNFKAKFELSTVW